MIERLNANRWSLDEPPPSIAHLARSYGIAIKPYNTVDDWLPVHRGFGENAIHLKKRIVFLPLYPETDKALHEMVHILVQAPWYESPWRLDDFPEDIFLLQYERALARHILGPVAMRALVTYQECTETHTYAEELGIVPNYLRTAMWRRGLGFARELDLLDDRNRPTFRMPKWTKRIKRQMEAAL